MNVELHLRVMKKIGDLNNFIENDFIEKCYELISYINKHTKINKESKLGYIYYIMKNVYKLFIIKEMEKDKLESEKK